MTPAVFSATATGTRRLGQHAPPSGGGDPVGLLGCCWYRPPLAGVGLELRETGAAAGNPPSSGSWWLYLAAGGQKDLIYALQAWRRQTHGLDSDKRAKTELYRRVWQSLHRIVSFRPVTPPDAPLRPPVLIRPA
jgi:hypothetical protein